MNKNTELSKLVRDNLLFKGIHGFWFPVKQVFQSQSFIVNARCLSTRVFLRSCHPMHSDPWNPLIPENHDHDKANFFIASTK